MAKKHASEEARAEKAKRIDICLKESGVRQVAASRHCDVSTQAISNWRKYGQVEDENLFKLSELTGFRYVWLKNGSGERRYSDAEASMAARFWAIYSAVALPVPLRLFSLDGFVVSATPIANLSNPLIGHYSTPLQKKNTQGGPI